MGYRQRRGNMKNTTCVEAGRKGGLTTLKRHGTDHYKKMGAVSRKRKEVT